MLDETLVIVTGSLTITVIAILVAFTYYKLRMKRLNLIEKGIWKSEYETKQLGNMAVTGAILVAAGIAVLIAVFMVKGEEQFMWVLGGLMPLLIGLSLIICFLAYRRTVRSAENRSQ